MQMLYVFTTDRNSTFFLLLNTCGNPEVMTMLGKKTTPVLQAVSAFSGFPEKLFSPSSLKVTSSVQLMFCATLSSDILQQLASSAMASEEK